MFVIAFAGPAGSGKTTAATILAQELGYSLLGFADPIKDTLLRLFTEWDQWHLSAGKDLVSRYYKVSPREAMQIIGDHGRGLQHDIYIHALEDRMKHEHDRGVAGIAIHDLRTEEEARWVRSVGGLVVHVSREGIEYADNHVTSREIRFSEEDIWLINSRGIDRLRRSVLACMTKWRLRMATAPHSPPWG